MFKRVDFRVFERNVCHRSGLGTILSIDGRLAALFYRDIPGQEWIDVARELSTVFRFGSASSVSAAACAAAAVGRGSMSAALKSALPITGLIGLLAPFAWYGCPDFHSRLRGDSIEPGSKIYEPVAVNPLLVSAPCRTRTYNKLIKSQLLYQLS